MVANIRCQEIKEEQLRRLEADQAWASLTQDASQQLLPDFGARSAALLDSCVTGWVPAARVGGEREGGAAILLLSQVAASGVVGCCGD